MNQKTAERAVAHQQVTAAQGNGNVVRAKMVAKIVTGDSEAVNALNQPSLALTPGDANDHYAYIMMFAQPLTTQILTQDTAALPIENILLHPIWDR